MTPREKAHELTDNYKRLFWQISIEQLKICALITVDEILEFIEDERQGFNWKTYYQEVKQEIENL